MRCYHALIVAIGSDDVESARAALDNGPLNLNGKACVYEANEKKPLADASFGTLPLCVIARKMFRSHGSLVNKEHLCLLRLLLERDANVDGRLSDGIWQLQHCPLIIGRMWRLKEPLELLLKAGADVNLKARNTTVLHQAVRVSRASIVRQLLTAHADVNAVDEEGKTPLHLAAKLIWATLRKILIDAGANVNAIDNAGRQPLHCTSNMNFIQLLLNAGADVNTQANEGQTPLDYFTNLAYHALIQILLLHTAAKPLLERGATMCVDDGANTLAHATAQTSYKIVFEVYLSHGGLVDVRDADGCTPLHTTYISYQRRRHDDESYANFMKRLIEEGAHVDVSDEDGQSFFDAIISII